MAQKIIYTSTQTSKSVYFIAKNLTSDVYLDDDSGDYSFQAAGDLTAAGVVAMVEDSVMLGLYTFDATDITFPNGKFIIVYYVQANSAPDPSSDSLIDVDTIDVRQNRFVAWNL